MVYGSFGNLIPLPSGEHLEMLSSLLKKKLFMVGIILVLIGLAGLALSYNLNTNDKIALSSNPTHSHKASSVNKKAAGQVEAAETTTDSSAPDNTQNNPAAQGATSPKSSAAPKKSSPVKTTIVPTPTPKPIQQPTTIPTHVTSATVQLLGHCGGAYKYTVNFAGNTNTTLAMHWEIVTGDAGYDYGLDPLPSAYPVLAGTTTIYDTRQSQYGNGDGMTLFEGHPYSARIHITSPTDFYTNTITVAVGC